MVLVLFIVLLAMPIAQAVTLTGGWSEGKRPWLAVTFAASLADGAAYLLYERLIDPEANIRVDLLLVYPALGLSLVLALIAGVKLLWLAAR